MQRRPKPQSRRLIRSAGAIVWRFRAGHDASAPGQPIALNEIEVLLVHRPQYRDWSWPKGKSEANEPIAQTAAREVEEETGEVIVLDNPLTTQRYRLGSGHTKEVHYWTAHSVGKGPIRAARRPVLRASTKEIDIARWCKPKKARQLLTRRGDRRLLDEVEHLAANGGLMSSALILLRHGKAASRASWGTNEETRPLTRLGGTQALDLVGLLSAFGADHLYASPWLRCQQTLQPYSSLSRLEIAADSRLTEAAAAVSPADVQEVTKELAAKKSGSHVICLHRPTLDGLLAPLLTDRGSHHFPQLDAPHIGLRPAEMFVVHLSHAGDKPQPIAIERHNAHTKILGG